MHDLGALIKARGVRNLSTPVSRRTYQEHRCTMLTIDLASRKSSFISHPESINAPWKASDPHAHVKLQQITDIGFQILPLMEILDQTKAAIKTSPLQNLGDNLNRRPQLLVRHTWRAEVALNEWEHRWLGLEPAVYCYIPRPSHSKTDDGKIYPITYTFPNFDMGSAIAYYDMIKIAIYDLLIDASNLSPPNSYYRGDVEVYFRKAIDSVDNICRSVDYFLVDFKNMTTRFVVLAPFQSAMVFVGKLLGDDTVKLELKADLTKKMEYCQKFLARSQELGFPQWKS